nr:retrotransposon protein, putative, unclassified [Tanacetum cinerariifolium]
ASIENISLTESVAHKRRLVAPEGRLALKEKVFYWLREGLIRKVLDPEWITNAVPIKLTNGTCKVQMDYSGLNKACAKDRYPFPEEEKELTSLMGYSYKCFL